MVDVASVVEHHQRALPAELKRHRNDILRRRTHDLLPGLKRSRERHFREAGVGRERPADVRPEACDERERARIESRS